MWLRLERPSDGHAHGVVLVQNVCGAWESPRLQATGLRLMTWDISLTQICNRTVMTTAAVDIFKSGTNEMHRCGTFLRDVHPENVVFVFFKANVYWILGHKGHYFHASNRLKKLKLLALTAQCNTTYFKSKQAHRLIKLQGNATYFGDMTARWGTPDTPHSHT